MPTRSIIAAVIARYNQLSPGGFPNGVRPKLHFDEMPATDASGAQFDAESGFVTLQDGGADVTPLGFERQVLESHTFTFEVYYPSLADVDMAVLAIRRDGESSANAMGFDWGTLTDLASPRGTFEIVRTREQRAMAGLGKTGKRVHVCKITYRVVVQEAA